MAGSKTFEAFSIKYAAILDGTTGAEVADFHGVRNGTLTANAGSWKNTGNDRNLSTWNWLEDANLSIEGGYINFDLYARMTGNTVTTNAAGTKASIVFTPEATGVNAFDYSTTHAITFTVNDGTGATTVALTTALTDIAGVVAAIDAILGAGYVVSAVGATVKIEAATAGMKAIAIGGTDAAAITGSAGYDSVIGTAVDEFSTLLWDDQCGNQGAWPVLLRMASLDRYKAKRVFDIVLFQVQMGPITLDGPKYKNGLGFSFNGVANFTDRDETGTLLPKRADNSQIEAIARMVNRPQLIS